MRSGSTLLKAILATRTDVSHLPEFDFQHLRDETHFKTLSAKRIIVLKKPRAYGDNNYPYIPSFIKKKIILVRDVGPTVHSLMIMNSKIKHTKIEWNELTLAQEYWVNTYKYILNTISLTDPNVFLLRYEDLVEDPISTSEALFKFIGSYNTEGTSTYEKPKQYTWKWFMDDGGETIKSLSIQKPKEYIFSNELQKTINENPSIIELRSIFGYT